MVEEDEKVHEAATNVLAKEYLAVCLKFAVKCESGITGLLDEMTNLKGRRLLNC